MNVWRMSVKKAFVSWWVSVYVFTPYAIILEMGSDVLGIKPVS